MERHGIRTRNWVSHQFLSNDDLRSVLYWLRFESGLLSYGEGVRTIRGYLNSIGIFVSRTRIQVIMQQIDAEGVLYRSREIRCLSLGSFGGAKYGDFVVVLYGVCMVIISSFLFC